MSSSKCLVIGEHSVYVQVCNCNVPLYHSFAVFIRGKYSLIADGHFHICRFCTFCSCHDTCRSNKGTINDELIRSDQITVNITTIIIHGISPDHLFYRIRSFYLFFGISDPKHTVI